MPAPPAPPAAGTVVRRRRPRWLLPVVLGAAVATAAGVAIALAVNPSPEPPAFLSGRSGTPTATATNSPVAITVCTVPAGGCTLAGAARDMAERPQQIDATGDGSQVVTGLSWTGWGSSRATATGTLRVNDCQPNCANGKVAGYPATVTVSGLTGTAGTAADLRPTPRSPSKRRPRRPRRIPSPRTRYRRDKDGHLGRRQAGSCRTATRRRSPRAHGWLIDIIAPGASPASTAKAAPTC